MLDLKPIKARLALATPGPWESAQACSYRDGKPVDIEYFVRRPEDDIAIASDILDPDDREPREANAILIANAPTDLAALVAEVERLRGKVERMGQWLNDMAELAEAAAVLDELASSVRSAVHTV